jgi:hypothetical protein
MTFRNFAAYNNYSIRVQIEMEQKLQRQPSPLGDPQFVCYWAEQHNF